MNVLDLASGKVKLKKVSGTHGGEWQGPCPGCGGQDRFHVWPNQNDGKGAYWCRGCEKAGDNIQFLRDFEGLGFREACARLDIVMAAEDGLRSPAPKQPRRDDFVPTAHSIPADVWQEKAENFLSWSRANLADNAEILAWLSGRGIDGETAKNFRLGWNEGEKGGDIYRARKAWGLPEVMKEDGKRRALWLPRGLVIPYILDGIVYRLRIRRPEGEPRYYIVPGSSMATMIVGRERRAFAVVESELDAIAVAAGNRLAGSVALGSASAKPDAEAFAILKSSLQILNALDYDDAGARAMAWWRENFDHCDRWPVPKGKDPGEAVRLGIDLDRWITAGLPPALTVDERRERNVKADSKAQRSSVRTQGMDTEKAKDLSPAIRELLELLRKNPAVKIVNTADRFTILRNGRYVGGRINELVFRFPDVTDYIAKHPAEEIDGENLILP